MLIVKFTSSGTITKLSGSLVTLTSVSTIASTSGSVEMGQSILRIAVFSTEMKLENLPQQPN